ncbi:hypothetical protein VTK73DRAFT_330 [Phialemonium thermophilum]|uniref:Uncharacterized protein n=1 Tax=Phialemonium thermophilum TaxID=223376 RepID=A0ABR3XEN4_9PEZI
MSETFDGSRASGVEVDNELIGETDDDGHGDRARKRKRSLRKGTRSCWACKRRKEKCSFEQGDTCAGCLRRGTKCVSQQFADDDQRVTTNAATATRLRRIEDMVAQLSSQIQSWSQMRNLVQHPSPTILRPSPARELPFPMGPTASTAHHASDVAANEHSASATSSGSTRSSRLHILSHTLHGSLPSPQDIQLLRKASARRPVLSTIHIAKSYATLRRDGIQPTDAVLSAPPPVTSHPVLIAKYMLQLAVLLQEMQCNTYPELDGLMEPVVVLTERCANTAMDLVMRQDDLLGSVESLEGVILESVYQCNCGRLRLSWIAVRRAMLLAQTMGLHLARKDSQQQRETLRFLDPSRTCVELPNLWFRIMHYDLQISRMLGLPPGTVDAAENPLSPYQTAVETPEGYLERVYCHVMVLALSRRSLNSSPLDVKTTQALDQELQRAANAVPSRWWLLPNVAENLGSPADLFWDMRRLILQMLHHDLRAQLNVPYMLARGEADRQRSEMARIACVNSSREVLLRFLLLRDFNRTASSCRFANFLGLMAAITLVLAHLGGNRRSQSQDQDEFSSHVDSLLSHQAPSDRAMMEQALETMRCLGHLSQDALCAQSADVLHRLLEIEASNKLHISSNKSYVSVHDHGHPDDQLGLLASAAASEKEERVFIPYFGVMRIVRLDDAGARRQARQRRDYLYRQALLLREAEISEKRAKLKASLATGKPLDPSIANDKQLRKDLQYDESQPDAVDLDLDDEYQALSGVVEPRVLVTTARDPSSRLNAFSKEIRLLFPTGIRLNRGNLILPEIVRSSQAAGLSDLVLLHEHRGVPTAMTISHLPHGPTVSFSLHNVVLRHDIPNSIRGTVSESYPHLIFEGFSTRVGKRIKRVLQHLFPPRDPLTSKHKAGNRVITFVNKDDVIEVRHHVFVKTSYQSVELSEVGPRMSMRPFEIRGGTLENKDGDVEWHLSQYTRTSRKKNYL